MPEIQLQHGLVALVDAEDMDLVKDSRWFAVWTGKGYRVARNVKDGTNKWRNEYLHRVLMNAEKGQIVDHINHDPLDNRRCNLRIVNDAQSIQNRRKQSNNTSGYKGVSFDKRRNKWSAEVWANKKKYFLGRFDDPAVAYAAYCEAVTRLHGEFAVLE